MGTIISPRFLNAKAMRVNGLDQYAFINNPSFVADTQGAFSGWYRPTALLSSGGVRTILGVGQTSADNKFMNFGQRHHTTTTPPNTPLFDLTYRAPTTVGGANSTAMVAGQLYHWVLQSNGTTQQVYIDGVLQTMTPWSGSPYGMWLGSIPTPKRLCIGAYIISNALGGYSDSKVDELIYVSGRPMTQAEITALYNSGTPTSPYRVVTLGSALKGHWRMGESRDNSPTIFNEAVNGVDNFTMVNMSNANFEAP